MLSAVQNDEATINTALSSLTPPATVSIDEVFTAESDQNQGRYIFVMDNITPSEIDPTDLWRVDNFCASRLPIETTVTLPNITTQTVYDVFAKTSLGTPSGGNGHRRPALAALAHLRHSAEGHRPRAAHGPEYRGHLRPAVQLDS